ncbi:MAG: arginine--tRNA ligase, partial [Firmicutes bacterium]|nr:arginine--tRNA ligase [Bacillota bacterium]
MISKAEADIRERLDAAVRVLAAEWGISPEPGGIELRRSDRPEHGDFATNAAMMIAGLSGRRPREAAEALCARLDLSGSWAEKVEVAGPGFINFFLGRRWLEGALREVVVKGDDYGRTGRGRGRKVLVEFVSANPTGPIIVVQARAGAVGDTLANLLDWAGYSVGREFYINDAGGQIAALGSSLEIRYRQLLGEEVSLPDDCYPGEYLVAIARRLLDEMGPHLTRLSPEERASLFARFAVDSILASQKESLRRYGVEFDVWFSERSLHDSGEVARVVELLLGRGYAYEREGAVWLKSTAFGDDKDRVLVKSDGSFTYLAPDIAYHLNKYARGFEELIDIWGPDHHGYISRMRAAVQALGKPADSFE